MYEYKVVVMSVRAAEEEMNSLAAEGWRVIDVTPNHAVGHGLIVTFERQR